MDGSSSFSVLKSKRLDWRELVNYRFNFYSPCVLPANAQEQYRTKVRFPTQNLAFLPALFNSGKVWCLLFKFASNYGEYIKITDNPQRFKNTNGLCFSFEAVIR